MSVDTFLDTNLFIYQLDRGDARKAKIAGHLIRWGLETGKACISFQVVQECLNTLLRKAEVSLTTEQTRLYLETVLTPLFQIPATIPLYHRALDIQMRYRYGFYDSLIIAAALEAGCKQLYTEDLHDGQRIEGLIIENPFKNQPKE